MASMSDLRWIRPVEGRHVRCPETRQALPREGKAVVWSSYWTRRVAAGDVIVLAAPAEEN